MVATRNENDSAPSTRVCRVWLAVMAVGLSLSLIALGARLFKIQVLDHSVYHAFAEKTHIAAESTRGYRGDIFSADGVLLARDTTKFKVGIDPTFVSKKNIPAVVRLICDAIGETEDYARRRQQRALEAKKRGVAFVHLGTRVDEETVAEIREALATFLDGKQIRGLTTSREMWRQYPRGSFAGHVVGVTNLQGEGVEGIELAMEPYLSPQNGRREFLVDASRERNRIFQLDNLYLEPVQAYDVHLTLDSRVQAIAEEELEAGVLHDKAEAGAILVMDCRTGDILAMASYPSYDPARFGEYPEEERERRRPNGVIEKLFEPGSVLKPLILSRALKAGVCRPEQNIRSLLGPRATWDGGKRAKFGYRTVRDTHEHANMTVEHALRYSSNIGLTAIGLRLGREGLKETFASFGLGEATGIRLPAEGVGEYPIDPWKPYDEGVSSCFGYAVMLSPLQLCRAFAAVVNGGYLLRPRLVKRLVRGSETHEFPQREVVGRPLDEETSSEMRRILRGVIEEEGTGRYLRLEGFRYGAKTGTARVQKNGNYHANDFLSSFEAFAPYKDPEVVIVCMVEKPRGSHHYGSWVAGPIVVQVIRRLFNIESQPAVKAYKERG